MKKSFLRHMTALLLALLMLLSCASAENAENPGNIPERGISLPITSEDAAMGISATFASAATGDGSELPLLLINYTDLEGLSAALAKYEGVDLSDQTLLYEAYMELSTYIHSLYEVALFESGYYNALMASGVDLSAMNPGVDVFVLGENDGYTYVVMDASSISKANAPQLQDQIDAAAARAKELLLAASFQDILFAESLPNETVDAFPAFSTSDLNGNAVDSGIFAQKDLTIVNVWATWCSPCVSEMPELAAWHASMPENMQIIGVTTDLLSLDDADTLETAKMIAEATGVTYPLLAASEDMNPLLRTVVGVPTTFFVDSTGRFVAEPIVGVNVAGCIAVAEAYLSSLQ